MPAPDRDREGMVASRGGRVDSTAQLQKHMTATYFTLRVGLAVLAVSFPILLYVFGRLGGDSRLRGSMSAYYHNPAARDVFVGALFGISIGLWAYKGFRGLENWALNAAALFAIGVALIPTPWDCGDACPTFTWHHGSAVLFFVCIGYVAVWRAKDTLPLLAQIRDAGEARKFRLAYNVIGWAMIVLPIAASIVARWFDRPGQDTTRVFWIEFAAVYAFAAYWIAKSLEMSRTQAERRAVQGRLQQQGERKTGARAITEPFTEKPVVSIDSP